MVPTDSAKIKVEEGEDYAVGHHILLIRQNLGKQRLSQANLSRKRGYKGDVKTTHFSEIH